MVRAASRDCRCDAIKEIIATASASEIAAEIAAAVEKQVS